MMSGYGLINAIIYKIVVLRCVGVEILITRDGLQYKTHYDQSRTKLSARMIFRQIELIIFRLELVRITSVYSKTFEWK